MRFMRTALPPLDQRRHAPHRRSEITLVGVFRLRKQVAQQPGQALGAVQDQAGVIEQTERVARRREAITLRWLSGSSAVICAGSLP